MDEFQEWHRRISEGRIEGFLQNEIADKILVLLEQRRDSLSAWDKLLFAQAITQLSINVNSIYQPTVAGLGRCLVALEEVMIPELQRHESSAQKDDKNELISFDKLVVTVKEIKTQIS